MEYFATCPKGFEQLLAQELRSLGCGQVRPLRGQVSFDGPLGDAYRACLWSRLASRVIAVLGRIDVSTSDALYEGMRSLPWVQHLALSTTFAVDAHGTNANLRNTAFIAQRAKDAIVDEMLARRGGRPMVDAAHPGLTVSVRVSRSRATVGIDLSGAPLFRRGYEGADQRRQRVAPLRADYAAALLCLGGWDAACQEARAAGEEPALFSLYAGTGTVLAEAAGMALGMAPGLVRIRWGFEGWLGHDQGAWEQECQRTRDQVDEGLGVRLLWHDTRRADMESARRMLHAAMMPAEVRLARPGEQAHLLVGDLSWVPQDELPQQAAALAQLAQAVGDRAPARIAVLTPDTLPDTVVGSHPSSTLDVMVGRDEATIRVYDDLSAAAGLPTVRVGAAEVAVYVPTSNQFAARLEKVARLREKWARREDVTCYRVYDADLPDYAVTIDLFEESLETAGERPRRWLQIYEYAPPKDVDEDLARRRLLDVLTIAPQVMGVRPQDVFVRRRERSRGGSQYASEAAQARGRSRMALGQPLEPGAHLVDEGGLTFEVNFSLRLDCGIFLDHRDTRAMLREMAKRTAGSKRFLNLFAYTGTASCYAADGGMRHTTTVDLSRPSLDWACRNMARNGFTGAEHEFVQADVLAWVSEQRHTPNRWDLVFCDVPTFSNSKGMGSRSFDVQRDHVELLIGVSRLLTRGKGEGAGGTCVFSCNLRTFRPDVEALAKAGVAIEDITAQTIPEDFSRNPRIHKCYLVTRA
jgi:23S rRNA (guanine2445-N2)-methyltransferase / 23S rRNA (guanine2069-N7)-methyltransferase